MAIAAVVALGTFTTKASNAQTTLPVQVQQIVASVDSGATFQDDTADEELSFTQDLKKRFIEGGPGFMGIVLLCLIGVQMGQLEKNVSWISLFIALAPMLGFMGTVIGMIQAFDKIEAAGDMNPALVAGGIKVALLTTVFGLIVAIILQIFYNYIIAKIDSIVNDMEDSSITTLKNYGIT